MSTRGIRGAITVEENSALEIEKATVELLETIIKENQLNKEDVAYVVFTLTSDLDAAFPAKFARLNLGFDNIPMICTNELDVPNSLRMCLRVLLVWNTDKKQDEIRHIYLKNAMKLRPDLVKK